MTYLSKFGTFSPFNFDFFTKANESKVVSGRDSCPMAGIGRQVDEVAWMGDSFDIFVVVRKLVTLRTYCTTISPASPLRAGECSQVK